MAYEGKKYQDIVEDILQQITNGVLREKHLYDPDRVRYKLRNTPVREIVRVTGQFRGSRHLFVKGKDYTREGDMLVWLPHGDRPDANTFFYVNYIFSEPSGITDINPGSVVRTIVESISREIEFLYHKMRFVYESAFIDTASGKSLDLLVSILGITRKPAEHAVGKVVFGRSTPPKAVPVNNETYIYDGSEEIILKQQPIESVRKVKGKVNNVSYEFKEDVDYMVTEKGIRWLPEGKKPDLNSILYIDYNTYEKITVPKGILVTTFSLDPTQVKRYVTTEEKTLERQEDGTWEATVEVMCLEPGKRGNTYAGSIVVMPAPIPGIEYVINREDITTGVEAETDEELRERAKKALVVAGKATLLSLETAIKGVEGVSALSIVDMPDGIPGLVKVIVDGGDEEEIIRVIDDVRAAGIKVEFERPKIVNVDVNITVLLEPDADPTRVKREIEDTIMQFIGSLNIGDDIIYAKLMGTIFRVKGVYDIEELTLSISRSEETKANLKENIEIAFNERAIPRKIVVLTKKRGKKV